MQGNRGDKVGSARPETSQSSCHGSTMASMPFPRLRQPPNAWHRHGMDCRIKSCNDGGGWETHYCLEISRPRVSQSSPGVTIGGRTNSCYCKSASTTPSRATDVIPDAGEAGDPGPTRIDIQNNPNFDNDNKGNDVAPYNLHRHAMARPWHPCRSLAADNRPTRGIVTAWIAGSSPAMTEVDGKLLFTNSVSAQDHTIQGS